MLRYEKNITAADFYNSLKLKYSPALNNCSLKACSTTVLFIGNFFRYRLPVI
jgi:hypothetical protein